MKISLNSRFSGALVLVGVLSITNFLVLDYHTRTSAMDANTINLAGRQRMLSGRIMSEASRMIIYRSDKAQLEASRQELLALFTKFSSEHEMLVHGDLRFTDSPAVRELYFGTGDNLDQQTDKFIQAARSLGGAENLDLGKNHPDYQTIGALYRPLTTGLNKAVAAYTTQAESRIAQLHWIELGGIVGQLLGLLFIGLAIFRPMANRITANIRSLEQSQAELIEKNRELAVQQARLEDFYRISERLKQQMEAILHAAGEGICGTDLEGRTVFFNESALKLFGYTRQEVLGVKLHGLVHHSYPDGSPWPEDGCPICAAIRQGEYFRGEVEVFWRKDGSGFPVEVVVNPLYEGKHLVGAVVSFDDISARKDAEKTIQKYMAELERSNRELDDFAYIASHDLKEPLRGIHNYATFLLEDYADKLGDEGKRYLGSMKQLAQRMEVLINTLLRYSRLGRAELDKAPCDMDGIVNDALSSLDTLLREAHGRVSIVGKLPVTICDRVLVTEVFHNLIANAMKYNENEQKTVEIGVAESPGAPLFYVRDNGIGIPEKHFDGIFRIFKRLHGQGKYGEGSGAGLTIVKKIIARHGGKIWLESAPGKGTTFFFTLQME